MVGFTDWQSPGYGNHNLLVNSNMRCPVNRRGQIKYASGYTIDMWTLYTDCGGTLSVGDNKIILSSPRDGVTQLSQYLKQKLEIGKAYIVSFEVNNTINTMQFAGGISKSMGFGAGLTIYYVNDARDRIVIGVNGTTVDIQAVKLELSTVSTLAADLKDPLPYEYELLRCLQYDLEGNYIGAVPASNPNLLINWDFRNPVNQRGQRSYTDGGYGIDMWFTSNSFPAQVTIGGNGLTLTPKGEGSARIHSKLENIQNLTNEMVTFSAIMDGNLKKATFFLGGASGGINIYADKTVLLFSVGNQIILDTMSEVVIQAVKLEVGTVSTLALDLMQPSDAAAERRKCQRYYYIVGEAGGLLGSGFMFNSIKARILFDLPENMRIHPTVTIRNPEQLSFFTADGMAGVATGISNVIQTTLNQSVTIEFFLDRDATPMIPVVAKTNSLVYVEFSAEL